MEISGIPDVSSNPSLSSFSFGALQARETDDEVMETEVYLYTRKLASLTGGTRSLENVLPDREEYHHWAFVFYFIKDESWRMAEGFSNKEGILFASYQKTRPPDEAKMRLVATIHISPVKLRDLVFANPLNEKKYKVTKDNCQEWAKNLATLLDDWLDDACIYKNIENFRTLKEVPLFEKLKVTTHGVSKASRAVASKPKTKKVSPKKQ